MRIDPVTTYLNELQTETASVGVFSFLDANIDPEGRISPSIYLSYFGQSERRAHSEHSGDGGGGRSDWLLAFVTLTIGQSDRIT